MSTVDRILEAARSEQKRIVFPEGTEGRTLRAVEQLSRRGIVRPILVGAPDAVREAARKEGCDISAVPLADPGDPVLRGECRTAIQQALSGRRIDPTQLESMLDRPLYFAAAMVRTGRADGSLGGAQHRTAEIILAALRVIRPAVDVEFVSSFFLMLLSQPTPSGDDVLAFADCGLVPDPNARQLADIALRTAGHYRLLMGREPRVALLSFSTKGSAEHRSIDKVVEACSRSVEGAGWRRGGFRQRLDLPGPQLRQHRLQTGGAASRSPGHRAGLAGALPAGQRPVPGVFGGRHRRGRGHHRGPGLRDGGHGHGRSIISTTGAHHRQSRSRAMDERRQKRKRRGKPPASARRTPPPDATGKEARFIAEKKEARAELNVHMRDGECICGHIEYYDRAMVKIVPASGPTVFVRKEQIRLIEEL
jgi:phosphate acetyltransferase